jgi:hypothetical protein
LSNGDDQRLLSLPCTAGAGLNLTAADHVFSFDRWWNPVVENPATDRASQFRENAAFTIFLIPCMRLPAGRCAQKSRRVRRMEYT